MAGPGQSNEANPSDTFLELTERAGEGFGLNILTKIVGSATDLAKAKLEAIKNRGSAISIADMFDMQMLMNHLSQFSEMSTSVVSAAQTAIMSMARNVKG